MSRLEKLKLENIKKANELLDKGHTTKYPPEEIKLKPSDNVTQNTQSFVNKMNNLTEGLNEDEEFVSRRGYDSNYTVENELSPTQQAVNDEVMAYIGQTFGSWMSPDNPPFSQEYAKGPYWETLSRGIKNIVTDNVE